MPNTSPLTIAVLLGSVRTDRQGIKAARLLLAALEKRGHEAVLVDPMVTRLPLLDRMYIELWQWVLSKKGVMGSYQRVS